jgi:predicted cupin superfamily sugar epimerase
LDEAILASYQEQKPMIRIENFKDVISSLQMIPHPEGGYYAETYRASERGQFTDRGLRSAGTSIYFLMPRGDVSKFHRLASDEIWHFHQGDPITVVTISTQGTIRRDVVGPVGLGEAKPQVIIPKNTWFGAMHEGPTNHGYTLVGCTVSPGFEFTDFELASKKELMKSFADASPETHEWISRLSD